MTTNSSKNTTLKISELTQPWLIYYRGNDYLSDIPVLHEIDGLELCVVSGYGLVGDGRTVRSVCMKALSAGLVFCTSETANKLALIYSDVSTSYPLRAESLWIPIQPADPIGSYLDIYQLWIGRGLCLSDCGKQEFVDRKEGSGLEHWVFVKPRK